MPRIETLIWPFLVSFSSVIWMDRPISSIEPPVSRPTAPIPGSTCSLPVCGFEFSLSVDSLMEKELWPMTQGYPLCCGGRGV